MPHVDVMARLSVVAGSQLGLFTRTQAYEARTTKEQLRRLVERGVVERVAPAVFRFAATPRSWHQRVLCAVLDGGPDCLASHRTAAALHAFDGFGQDVIEVLVPMRIRHIRNDVVVHHTRALAPSDRALVGAIPVTSRARTLIDLGAVAPATLVEEAFDGRRARSYGPTKRGRTEVSRAASPWPERDRGDDAGARRATRS